MMNKLSRVSEKFFILKRIEMLQYSVQVLFLLLFYVFLQNIYIK